jgi:lysophospholipase L1-like esterase
MGIVAFGDSTTAPRNVGSTHSGRPIGTSTMGQNAADPTNPPHNIVNVVNHTSPFLYVYSDVLRDALPGLGVSVSAVDNEGISANRTDQALSRLAADVLSKTPNVVIIQFGLNDAWWDSGQPTDLNNPDSSGARVAIDYAAQTGGDGILGNGNDHPHANRGNYTDNLTQIVDTLQAVDVDVILMTPNPVTFTGSLAWWNGLVGQYAEVVRNVAAARDSHLVDVWNVFEAYGSQPGQSISDLMLTDALHPNGLGHNLIGDALSTLIVNEIALPGDFNNNGVVDASDYVVWRKGIDVAPTSGNYTLWRTNFDRTQSGTAGTPANTAAPEPTSVAMLIMVVATCCQRRRVAA